MEFFTSNPTYAALALMVVALVVGSVIRLGWARLHPEEDSPERRASLGTWWVLVIVFAIAVAAGAIGVIFFMALASAFGLRELGRMVVNDREQRLARRFVYLLVPFAFIGILLGAGSVVLSIVPMATVVLVTLAQVVEGYPRTYLRFTGGLLLGAVTLIYGLGHAAQLTKAVVSTPEAPRAVAWFLFLVLLTEINDISQALVGRRIGRTKITPRLSPNKSWEGLIGGLLITVGLAVALAPWLTTLADAPLQLTDDLAVPFFWPVAAGMVISLAGFLGDLNMSGVKRFTGVKDSSDALPGMGGILDRVDSLTLTAPCFYWLIVMPFLTVTGTP